MRARTVLIALLCSAALCAGTSIALGAAAGVAVAAVCFFLCCALALFESTQGNDTQLIEHSNDHYRDRVGAQTQQEEASPHAPEPHDDGDTADSGIPEPTVELEITAEAETEPGPQAASASKHGLEPEPESPTHTFDYAAFEQSLLLSSHPFETLRETVGALRAHKDRGESLTGVESFLVRLMEDAGLFERDGAKDAPAGIVRLYRSGLYYVKPYEPRIAYGTMLRILRVESALNALAFCHEYYEDLSAIEEEAFFKLWQRTHTSICAQTTDIDTADWSYLAMPWQASYGPSEQGEWALRYALSESLESLRLPYRLDATFRCNVSGGDVALEFKATPAHVFPSSAYVSGLGIVSTTSEMRKREASAYAARLGILLANQAFHASTKIRRVWIAAIEEGPTKHSCLYSVCIERRALSRVRMSTVTDPLATLRSLGASLVEVNDVLVGSQSHFYLEDERFCPSSRYDLWHLSERSLPASAARSLGTPRVSGLIVNEELPRSAAAEQLMGKLIAAQEPATTQSSVAALLDTARDMSDISVWTAAERVASQLVDGKLDADEPATIGKELIDGDPLNKAVDQAQVLLLKRNPHEALRILTSALKPFESSGSYDDTSAVAYRSFDNFVERVIYNRLHARDTRSVVLVPDAYVMARLVLSAILISLPEEEGGGGAKALHHARRAVQVAPLNISANLGMAACLEATGDLAEAAQQITSYLEVAYHPQGIGLAYYRLGSIEWALGNKDVSLACFQKSVQVFPPLLPFVMQTSHELQGADGPDVIELMSTSDIEQALRSEEIPIAPTSRTAWILYDGATASIDAEVFPVARELMQILELLTGDDVIHAVRMSLEHEPDV